MKKLILSISLVWFVLSAFGQSPNLFNYQAVVRDEMNQTLASQQISIKMKILENSENGTVVYEEIHQTTSSSNGVVNLQIGNGQNKIGDFTSIDWANKNHWLQVAMDDSGNNNFTVIGTNQLISVPYALHAETATHIDDADADPNNELQMLSFDSNNNELSISNGNTITIPSGGTDADADPTNEIQDLTSSKSETLVTVNITDGQGTSFDVADPDADPTNEIQNLTLNGQMLGINSGNTIDLAPFATPWKPSTSWDPHGIYYDGDVYMDTVSVDWQLKVGNNNPYGTQIFDTDFFMNDFVNNQSYSLTAGRALFKDDQDISRSQWNRDSLIFSYDPGGLLWPLTLNINAGSMHYNSLVNDLILGAFGIDMRTDMYDSYFYSSEWVVNQILTPSDIFERFSIRPDTLKFFNDTKWKTVQMGTDKFTKHGYLNLFDGHGNMNASLGTNYWTIFGEPVNTGGLQLFSENNLTVQLESVFDGGILNMFRKNGSWISSFGSDELGRGKLALHDLDGTEKIDLSIDEFGNACMSAQGCMTIKDQQNRVTNSADQFGFSLWNPENGDLMGGLEFMFTDELTGMIYTSGANAYNNFQAGPNLMDNHLNGGFAGVYNSSGTPRAYMKVDADEKGSFTADYYSLTGSSGNQRALLHTQEDHDAGSLLLYGPNGNLNVSLDYNGINYNYGAIGIHDENGNTRAGFFINANTGQGEIFADVKHFVTADPTDPEKEIWYASLEGPEAAAYVRGTSQLVNGEAFVEFPEHFKHVASPESMTIILTPLFWDTYGLAAVEKTTNGFKVKELKGGNGEFSFDWEVKCVRKGFENYQVVRDKEPERKRMNLRDSFDGQNNQMPYHQKRH